MGTEIIRLPKISPKFIFSHAAGGHNVSTLNPGEYVPRPEGVLLYQDHSDLYGDDQGLRVELWQATNGTATSAEIFAACPYIRQWKEAQTRAEGARRLALLASPYRQEERETWPYQRAEALAWVADNATPTPYCDIIATGRGIPRVMFIPKVLENSTLFFQASAAILGKQQELIDKVYATQDFATFWATDWP